MIRNFLYLDSEKLRSISSQLFEGVTEQILLTERDGDTDQESQKAPLGSGRVLANIFSKESSSSELKFLEDHAYTIFEERLIELNLVNLIESSSQVDIEKKFIKISSRLRVNDLATSHKMLREFNEVGDAIWRVSNIATISGGDKGKPLSEGEIKRRAAAEGLQLDKRFAESAARLIEFGYDGMLEASMVLDDLLFSAPLKRNFLRDAENLILHKYSRHTQTNFSMIGIVTQRADNSSGEETLPQVKDADGIKEAMRALALHLRTVEQFFAGPSAGETIIDPIAIYSVL